MKKTRLCSIVLAVAMMVTTVVPAMAENIDNQELTGATTLDENEDISTQNPSDPSEDSGNQVEEDEIKVDENTNQVEENNLETDDNQLPSLFSMVRATNSGQVHQVVENGKKYFEYEDGTHLTGWYNLTSTWLLYLNPNDDGAAVTGYQVIDGKEYIFNSDGLVNQQYGTPIIDGKKYWVTGDGTIRTGWLTLGNMRLYFDPTRKYALVGIHNVEGKNYLFNSDGVLTAQAGTPVIDGKKYWFQEDGSLGTGWLHLTNWQMYFNPTTFEATVGKLEIDGKKYIFNSDGVCNAFPSTGLIDGKKYWFNADGSLSVGWQELGNMKLYMFPDTWYAATGLTEIDGKRYYFDENGVMRTGSVNVNGTLYLFNTDGTMFTESGTPTINGKKYCVNSDGTIRTGWVTVGSWVFYCNPSDGGAMAKGLTQIDGKRYYFSNNGDMITTNGIYNGQEYIFNADGSIASISEPSAYMTVIRNIFYAVETGGQVYGGAAYGNVSLEYSNTNTEHAITIGAGAWFATEAQRLLNLIRSTDPQTFAQLDTAGIAHDLDTANWSTYKLSGQPAKVNCISTIINSSVGRQCQDQLMNEEIMSYMEEAEALGVTDLKAKAMCANFRHHGGYRAMVRVLGKTARPYTLDNLYAACQTDTGNQVGAYRSRQRFVYNNLKSRIV